MIVVNEKVSRVVTRKTLAELKLGDVVELFVGPYGHATVFDLTEPGVVKVFRPYVHTGDFSYGRGQGLVITYIGHEVVSLVNTDHMYEVIDNGRELK